MVEIPDQCPVEGCNQKWMTSPKNLDDLVGGVGEAILEILNTVSWQDMSLNEDHCHGFDPYMDSDVYCYGSGGHIVDLEKEEDVTEEYL